MVLGMACENGKGIDYDNATLVKNESVSDNSGHNKNHSHLALIIILIQP